jgi:hypothetical protein
MSYIISALEYDKGHLDYGARSFFSKTSQISLFNKPVQAMGNIQLYITHQEDVLRDQIREHNLIYFASEAAAKMEFADIEEFQEAVKRAMELCLHAGIPLDMHFKRIYKCSFAGIIYDWKLSVLAFELVCLNGSAANPNVARMQIELVKNQSSRHIWTQ